VASVLPPAETRSVWLARIQHPLHSLRGLIRWYIFLEGTLLAVLYLAVWFWLGLALDYGPFRLFAFDWIQELNEALEADAARWVRGGLLAALGLGLVALLAVQLLSRLLREFRDPALALVLERRFPQELGDRLITAVELADPRLAQRYGYSPAMIEQTLREAAARVERLPVREVFNWRRLRRLALLAGTCLLAPLLLSGAGYTLWAWSQEQPLNHFWPRLANVALLWSERNILLQDVYWPRQAFLELHRFADAPAHPGEMRLARDEQRPDLLVRAIRWVVADRQAPGGWRPLLWRDLPAFVPADLLDIPLPRDWDGWIFDPDDLDFPLATTVLPAAWRGKPARFLRRQLEDAQLVQRLQAAGALEPLRRWLDWHTWSLDQLERQLMPAEKTDVRQPMRRQYPQAVRRWEDLFAYLNDLAEQPTMELHLRRLETPEVVFFTYRGQTTKGQTPHKQEEGNKYLIGLGELKESVRFTVRGGDYTTPSRQLTLVPPPGLTSLVMDKEEPAYIYWRLQGDQTPLKGKRQYFASVPLSLTGEVTQLVLPLGSSLRLRARSERRLQERVLLLPPTRRKIAGSLTPTVSVQRDADAQGFQFALPEVHHPIEFEVHFFDEDGVRGRRHVVIEPLDDRGPQEVVPVELAVALRQLRPVGKGPAAVPAGFLVTPDAALPLKGTFTDDYGLSALDWIWQGEEIEFELLSISAPRAGQTGEKGALLPASSTRLRRLGLVVSGLAYFPLSPGAAWALPAHWSWLERFLTFDLQRGQVPWSTFTGQASLKGFQERLQEREVLAIPAQALEDKLRQPPPKDIHLRTYSLERNEIFDLRQYLPGLKPRDPSKESQRHYRLQLFVAATDNNIETGPTRVLSKVPITLLVVSENELLAQILLEEETLRARLERALEKLKTARTLVQEQSGKLQLTAPPLDLIALRFEEVRDRFLPDAGNLVREVAGDYQRILREMEVNRIQEQRIDNVDKKICRPLEAILAPNLGPFARAEAAVRQCSDQLDADLGASKENALPPARRDVHLNNALQAQEQLARLIEQLEEVLQAIGGELVERELIALLVEIEQRQRSQSEVLRRRWEQLQRELLEFLRNPSGEQK
jgi:hypothetical protein